MHQTFADVAQSGSLTAVARCSRPSGWANPTLTIIALSLKLADHLAAKA